MRTIHVLASLALAGVAAAASPVALVAEAPPAEVATHASNSVRDDHYGGGLHAAIGVAQPPRGARVTDALVLATAGATVFLVAFLLVRLL